MSVIDLITRVDAICKKYDKYDIDRQKDATAAAGDDGFARLYAAIESDLNQAIQKSESAAAEKNRATAVAINAEIRRTKARLLEELPKLQRLALKKARSDLVPVLKERIEAVPDGSTSAPKQTGGWAPSASRTGIKIDSNAGGNFDNGYFQHTEESNNFRQEYEMRKMRQASVQFFLKDEGLEVIAEGLDTLKNMASDMNEELDRQVSLMDEIDDKVDRANADLKNTNVRLKDTVTQLRSSRNFCIDIILLCIILGIAAYLY
ncbi:hypothetical protein RJ639_037988, partial [Escallonia herrerae]